MLSARNYAYFMQIKTYEVFALKICYCAVTRFYYFHLCAVALGFTTVYAYNYAILDYINAFLSKQENH